MLSLHCDLTYQTPFLVQVSDFSLLNTARLHQRKRVPILFEAVLAVQLQVASVITPPEERKPTQSQVKVESYIEKPLVATTEVTIEEKPKQKVSVGRVFTNPRSTEVKIIGTSNEQCVPFARRITGNQKVRGYAGDLQSEGFEPQIGAVALDRSYGHSSVVVDILPDGRLVLNDANYRVGYITERIVDRTSQRGYIYN